MALTYSQKRFIQDNFQKKSNSEIAHILKISVDDVNEHIERYFKVNNKKISLTTDKDDVVVSNINVSFRTWIKEHWINLLVLLFFILIVYANGLTADLVSDDIPAITDLEKELQTPAYMSTIPTFAARTVQYYIAYKIGGLTPIFYRMFNIFFHIGFVWMIYILVPFFTRKKIMPFLVAALAAVHPIMVESVTWISGGIYSQAAFSLLVSFFFYIRYRQHSKKKFIFLSLLFFLLALSASEKVIVYPAILFLYEFTIYNVWKTWTRTVPYFILSLLWLIMILGRVNSRIQYLEQIGSLDFGKNIYNPLEQIPTAVATYLELLFWPDKLTLYHSEFRLNFYQFLSLLSIFLVYAGVTIYTYFKK